MRISSWIVLLAALGAAGVVTLIGLAITQPDVPLITRAGFSLDRITPNADGDSDVTEFSYSLSASAAVTLEFFASDGRRYAFREDEPRIPGDYAVLFSGVVDGFSLPDDDVSGEIMRRLMPNGVYTWRLSARESGTGAVEERTGTLTIADGGNELPDLLNFSVSPAVFTPNQDGIDDRTNITVYLARPAELTVFLVGPDGGQIFIPERQEGRKPGEAGRHEFDYDGGIDLGVQPPPDGDYLLVAEAQDLEGQRVRQTASLTILSGGDPQAEIAPQPSGADVVFAVRPYDPRYLSSAGNPGARVDPPQDPSNLGLSAITMPLGDLLVFKLTVENYGEVPIRTSGPWPGTVYQQDQVWGAMGVYEESGSWRVGLNCSTTTRDFPWRWAVGAPDSLDVVTDPVTGKTYYYLPAGRQSVVWGAVRLTDLVEARNPQQCWAGLIHEDVEVSLRNSRVGARDIELVRTTQ